MSRPPIVSVVVATYNRSRVLARAIESVRRSTLDDWELVVVGDHCTDDTASIVASVGDPRIRFVNLPQNVGEQSGPNNEGVRLARGRYIAFLNHDDMYFPDHLAATIACLDETNADLVWVPIVVALPAAGGNSVTEPLKFRLSGVPPDGTFDPRLFVFASAWVLKRELADRVGAWRHARETFVSSSQDWLFRASRAGARMVFSPRATVLAVPAGPRRGSYASSESPEHDYFDEQMRTNPRFRDTAIEAAALSAEAEANRFRLGSAVMKSIRGVLFRPVSAVAIACGVHPLAPFFALRYGRRGNLIDAVRRRTGLGQLSR